MAVYKTVTILFIGSGALVMLLSLVSTRAIIRRLAASRHRFTWYVMSVLMAVFLCGYAAAALLLYLDQTRIVLYLTGAVFFGGALFVYLVVRTGYLTIEEDHRIMTDLMRRGEEAERELADLDLQVETSEIRYRLLVENSGLPILYLGLDGTLFFINRDGARLFRKTPDRLIGLRLREIIANRTRRIEAGIRKVARTPEGAVFEVDVDLPGGTRWFLAICRPIRSEAGTLVAVQVVAQDVTDRRRAEQAIREQKIVYDQIMDNMGMELALFDREKRYEYVNPQAIKSPEVREWLIGRSNEEFVRRKGWDPKIARDRDSLLERVFTGKQELRFEEENVTPAGEVRNVLRVLTPIFNRQGEVVKIVGQGLEITEQKRVQRELAAARDLAESANRAKSEFLANMSHEIRTPLNAVLGMAELLAETGLNEQQRSFLEVARKAGDNLLSLINDILDLSRIESGRFEIESIPFELEERVAATCEQFRERARSKGLELRYEIDPALPAGLRGDPVRLQQILANLIGNAVKFTEKGSVRLSVRPGDRPEEIAFQVVDTGPGIPPAVRETIFETFVQADSSTTRRFGGTGLGLAISRRLADFMDGRIEMESQVGVGSRFRLTLPLQPATVHASPATEARARTEDELRPLDILLAEDHPDNRLLIEVFLKKTRCRLQHAENGQQALEFFQERKFDLVLLDMQMPIMDGYTAAGRMRAYERESGREPTPIVALTAHALKEEEEKCLRAGCDRHLAKPIRKDVLIRLLAEIG